MDSNYFFFFNFGVLFVFWNSKRLKKFSPALDLRRLKNAMHDCSYNGYSFILWKGSKLTLQIRYSLVADIMRLYIPFQRCTSSVFSSKTLKPRTAKKVRCCCRQALQNLRACIWCLKCPKDRRDGWFVTELMLNLMQLMGNAEETTVLQACPATG